MYWCHDCKRKGLTLLLLLSSTTTVACTVPGVPAVRHCRVDLAEDPDAMNRVILPWLAGDGGPVSKTRFPFINLCLLCQIKCALHASSGPTRLDRKRWRSRLRQPECNSEEDGKTRIFSSKQDLYQMYIEFEQSLNYKSYRSSSTHNHLARYFVIGGAVCLVVSARLGGQTSTENSYSNLGGIIHEQLCETKEKASLYLNASKVSSRVQNEVAHATSSNHF